MNLEQKLEAVLFFKGEPVSSKKLAQILEVSINEIDAALINLKNNLNNRGITLIEYENQFTLGTNPGISSLIEKLQKEDLNKNLSKASLETLSIILYKNGISRAEIDYIRGVNSSFILRILSIRGLINKYFDPKDNRRYLYKPSFELLAYLGVQNIKELPDFEKINNNLKENIESLNELNLNQDAETE